MERARRYRAKQAASASAPLSAEALEERKGAFHKKLKRLRRSWGNCSKQRQSERKLASFAASARLDLAEGLLPEEERSP